MKENIIIFLLGLTIVQDPGGRGGSVVADLLLISFNLFLHMVYGVTEKIN